jgi:hypothetical protein
MSVCLMAPPHAVESTTTRDERTSDVSRSGHGSRSNSPRRATWLGSHCAFSRLDVTHMLRLSSRKSALRPVCHWFDGRFILVAWKRLFGWIRRVGSWLGRNGLGRWHGSWLARPPGSIHASGTHGLLLLPVMPAAAWAEVCTTISTRRLLARPSGVSFDATGLASPRQIARNFSALTPWLAR